MIEAMTKEVRLRQSYLQKEPLNTIYFGGGTPSLLSAEELNTLLQATRETYWVNTEAEITLEANPDDITEDRLMAWEKAGINRLSIGIQSFHEEDLRWMNRAHSAAQSTAALQLSLQYFDNITIDLIYGLPALTDAQWKENVDRALALGISHLSCYALTVEPQTPLDKQVRLQQKPATDPDKQAAQFLLLMEWMEHAGYTYLSTNMRQDFHDIWDAGFFEGQEAMRERCLATTRKESGNVAIRIHGAIRTLEAR